MANANAQYPICDFGPLDKVYYTHTVGKTLDDIRKKMIGSNLYDEKSTTGTTTQTEFKNITAHATKKNAYDIKFF